MSFEITLAQKESDMGTYEVTERLYRTEDGKVVPEGHEDARWLYAVPGSSIPIAEAQRYGLMKGKAEKAEKAPEATASEAAEPAAPEDTPDEARAPKPKQRAKRKKTSKGTVSLPRPEDDPETPKE